MQEEIKQASISKLVEMIAHGTAARLVGSYARTEEEGILMAKDMLRDNRQHQYKVKQVQDRRRNRDSMKAYAAAASIELDARLAKL